MADSDDRRLEPTRDFSVLERKAPPQEKIVYTPEELLALEDQGILPEGCELPDRSFYRFDALVLLKINSYMQNVNNNSYGSKKGNKRNGHRLKDHHHSNIDNAYMHSCRTEEEDTDVPEWMEETDFKVDKDFQLYMKSGTHTTDDFEREKKLFHSKIMLPLPEAQRRKIATAFQVQMGMLLPQR